MFMLRIVLSALVFSSLLVARSAPRRLGRFRPQMQASRGQIAPRYYRQMGLGYSPMRPHYYRAVPQRFAQPVYPAPVAPPMATPAFGNHQLDAPTPIAQRPRAVAPPVVVADADPLAGNFRQLTEQLKTPSTGKFDPSAWVGRCIRREEKFLASVQGRQSSVQYSLTNQFNAHLSFVTRVGEPTIKGNSPELDPVGKTIEFGTSGELGFEPGSRQLVGREQEQLNSPTHFSLSFLNRKLNTFTGPPGSDPSVRVDLGEDKTQRVGSYEIDGRKRIVSLRRTDSFYQALAPDQGRFPVSQTELVCVHIPREEAEGLSGKRVPYDLIHPYSNEKLDPMEVERLFNLK